MTATAKSKSMQQDNSFEVDFDSAEPAAVAAAKLLHELRARHDLSKWEYTKKIRIVPDEIPHSHPVLTLNCSRALDPSHDEDAFLSVYLHEQIHWGLGRREAENSRTIDELAILYPEFHVGLPETAGDWFSTYLHLVVNWLEIEAAAEFIGRERAEAEARKAPVYSKIYQTVLADHDSIEALLLTTGVLPLPPANTAE